MQREIKSKKFGYDKFSIENPGWLSGFDNEWHLQDDYEGLCTGHDSESDRFGLQIPLEFIDAYSFIYSWFYGLDTISTPARIMAKSKRMTFYANVKRWSRGWIEI